MWSGQWPGPEPADSGRAWASYMTIVLRAGPGLGILFAGRAGPGPHNSVCVPGPGRVYTTAAGPGRAWASNQICGPGMGLNVRPVQGPNTDPIYHCNVDVFVSPVHIEYDYSAFITTGIKKEPTVIKRIFASSANVRY